MVHSGELDSQIHKPILVRLALVQLLSIEHEAIRRPVMGLSDEGVTYEEPKGNMWVQRGLGPLTLGLLDPSADQLSY